jgi:flagellar biosynthesis/type III secretory pathway chaperone
MERVLNAAEDLNGGELETLSLFLNSVKTSEKDGFLNKYDKIMSNLKKVQTINLKNGYIVNGLKRVNSETLNIVTGTSGQNEVTYGPAGSKQKARKGSVKVGEV